MSAPSRLDTLGELKLHVQIVAWLNVGLLVLGALAIPVLFIAGLVFATLFSAADLPPVFAWLAGVGWLALAAFVAATLLLHALTAWGLLAGRSWGWVIGVVSAALLVFQFNLISTSIGVYTLVILLQAPVRRAYL